MKITLSKAQWEAVGKKAGWIKQAQTLSPAQPQANAIADQSQQNIKLKPKWQDENKKTLAKYQPILELPQEKQQILINYFNAGYPHRPLRNGFDFTSMEDILHDLATSHPNEVWPLESILKQEEARLQQSQQSRKINEDRMKKKEERRNQMQPKAQPQPQQPAQALQQASAKRVIIKSFNVKNIKTAQPIPRSNDYMGEEKQTDSLINQKPAQPQPAQQQPAQQSQPTPQQTALPAGRKKSDAEINEKAQVILTNGMDVWNELASLAEGDSETMAELGQYYKGWAIADFQKLFELYKAAKKIPGAKGSYSIY